MVSLFLNITNGPRSRHEAINRYVERDRLQALFAKAVVLIASYEAVMEIVVPVMLWEKHILTDISPVLCTMKEQIAKC